VGRRSVPSCVGFLRRFRRPDVNLRIDNDHTRVIVRVSCSRQSLDTRFPRYTAFRRCSLPTQDDRPWPSSRVLRYSAVLADTQEPGRCRIEGWCASAPYGFDCIKLTSFSAASSPVRTQSEIPTP
jgi:hypothetical protein